MEIIFATGNKKKFEVALSAFLGKDIRLIQKKIETPEIQAEDSREIAEYSAQYAANLLGKPVIKTDTSWKINALNGFPGPFAKYVNKWFSPEDYLKLLNEKEDRSVQIKEYLSYCEPGKKPITFCGVAKGTIAMAPAGNRGTVLDKIFIPEGFSLTTAELPGDIVTEFWAKNLLCWEEFSKYIEKEGLK